MLKGVHFTLRVDGKGATIDNPLRLNWSGLS